MDFHIFCTVKSIVANKFEIIDGDICAVHAKIITPGLYMCKFYTLTVPERLCRIGKIHMYEAPARSALLDAPRQYALGQTHKHLKEMKQMTGLASEPVFCPVVSDFYSGMQVTVPLFAQWLKPGASMQDVRAVYQALYTGPVVSYTDAADAGGFLSAAALAGKDSMQIAVAGNEERMLLLAVYDNLGKGASGAAVECMNLVTGAEKTLGLEL